ncbi:MAG: diphosphomevalonate decarboxylase [Bacteroidota bacterium]
MLTYTNPDLVLAEPKNHSGSIRWKSPSNLAIIKYWGKHGRQLPRNPSISFTLDDACTDTQVDFSPKTDQSTSAIELDFRFEGQPNEAFRTKMLGFLENIRDIFPFLGQLHLKVQSSNSFPHSAGIASSASSMSALALCLCSIERELFGTLQDQPSFYQKASFIARLGSGSACRSLYSTMAIWGESEDAAGSSDLYAIPYTETLHPIFKSFHDDILIVSKGEKSVSSRAGHALMEGNRYAAQRYQQANDRFGQLLSALQSGDLDTFGRITENEALTLHALMMTSNPSYILMHPNSLAIIDALRNFRKGTGHPLYFSLDAGPNVHLLYPDHAKSAVKDFIKSDLLAFCVDQTWIPDQVGDGPKELKPV